MTNKEKIFEDYSFQVVDDLFDKYDGQLEMMPKKERQVVRLWRLEADMYNGGFLQFFCNWGFENYQEACEVLGLIGAPKALAIIKESESIVSLVKDDKALKSYADIPVLLKKSISAEQWDRLDVLDSMYWKDKDNIQLKAYEYFLRDE